MRQFSLSILFSGIFFIPLLSQSPTELNNTERCYLYHTVKKSPILDKEIGRYFEYYGPEIRISADELNHDSIEQLILQQPELLFIRTGEIAKCEKGIIAEAANKMALWELNKMLFAKRGNAEDLLPYAEAISIFESLLVENLPASALERKADGSFMPRDKIWSLCNPQFYQYERINLLTTYRFLNAVEQYETMKAVQKSIQMYTEKRSLDIYRSLGGPSTSYRNILLAAGDGKITADSFEEREKNEKGKWSKGLPKSIGFFPYNLTYEPDALEERDQFKAMRYGVMNLKTPGDNRATSIHFDVWGFNPNQQTTVIVEKNGKQYPLFGVKESRFLTPDSAFGGGRTFHGMMEDFEENYINALDKQIYGRKGIIWSIDHYTKKRDEAEVRLMKAEYTYSDLHRNPVETMNRQTKAAKKKKKYYKKNPNAKRKEEEILVLPGTVTKDGRIEKGSKENEIVYLMGEIEALNKTIAEYNVIKIKGLRMLELYRSQLSMYKRLLGENWVSSKSNGNTFYFKDGARFDIETQEFTFPASMEKEDFEIRMLPIPIKPDSSETDELMLHVNVIDVIPFHDARIQLRLNDAFDTNAWAVRSPLFAPADSIAVKELFESMLQGKKSIEVVATGGGVGAWNGCSVVHHDKPVLFQTYPTDENNGDYKKLRTTELFVELEKNIRITVQSYTDGLEAQISIPEKFTSAMEKYRLNKNDVLTAYRTAEVLKRFQSEIAEMAAHFLSVDQREKVIKQMKKAISGTKINAGGAKFNLSDF